MIPLLCLLISEPVVKSDEFTPAVQRAALSATVRIAGREPTRNGSGVVVGQKDGFAYVLTAAHLVEKSRRFEVQTFTRKSYPNAAATYSKVEILWRASDSDVALLRFPTGDDKLPTLPIAPRGSVSRPPFPALYVGSALAAAPSCHAEEVAAKKLLKDADGRAAFFWQIAATPDAGCSGGPMLDRSGKLIGICSGTQDGKGYFSHLDEILAALRKRNAGWLVPVVKGPNP